MNITTKRRKQLGLHAGVFGLSLFANCDTRRAIGDTTTKDMRPYRDNANGQWHQSQQLNEHCYSHYAFLYTRAWCFLQGSS